MVSGMAVFLSVTAFSPIAVAQTPGARGRAVVDAGIARATSELVSEGESEVGMSAVLRAGIRLRNTITVGAEVRHWRVFDWDEGDFLLAVLDYLPFAGLGLPGLRLSGGLGAGRIEGRHPYGHQHLDFQGTAPAWMAGVAYEARLGRIAVSPFATLNSTVGSSLAGRSCSAPGYLWGNYTEVCRDTRVGPAKVVSLGATVGIR
jgi:hypothetical protein